MKIIGISLLSILALLFIIPFFIPDTITKEITKWANRNIKGEVHFEKTSLSFFKHFPSLTLSLHNFTLKGSAPFQQDTLLHTKELALGVDLRSIFSDQVKINQFFLDEANINILVDEKGNANYNVYESNSKPSTKNDTSATSLKIDGIFINKSNLVYNDKSIPMLINAKGLNYSGKGDLSKAIFDLQSKAKIDTLDIYYANTPYLLHKKLNAKLITKINTNSLELIFDENNLKINSLPISFVGKFSFLKDGYDINFKTAAKETDLHNIFTALPPLIADRMATTNIKGYAEINASLIGKYIAKEHLAPTLAFNMKVREGYISNPNAPEPIRNLYLNLQTKLPSLNPDSLYINMDSLYFNLGADYLSSVIKIKGLNEPEIQTKIRSNIDLEKWGKVVNMDSLHLKGRFVLDLKADGKYTKKVVKSGIRQIDTVIATIPKFTLKSALSNGYMKFLALPSAIDKIEFNINGSNTDGDYKNTKLELNNINIQALQNYIRGYAKLQTAENMQIDAQLSSLFNLADIKSFYPLKGYDLNGNLNLDIKSKGKYNKKNKLFPTTTAFIKLNDGRIKTSNFSEALEKINVDATLVNTDGTLKNSQLTIKPISFSMANQPFLLKADIKNFENIAYNITSKGTIDIGKMYQLFAVKGYSVKGLIVTDVVFKGLQSDATNGRYNRLNNSGSLKIENITLNSDLFPKAFVIKNGVFSFAQEKMKFNQFNASYGNSDFNLNGHLNNVINYAMADSKAKLKGQLNLKSDKLYVDEFMAYASSQPSTKSSSNNGVILIPNNLNISFTANANTVFYNGLTIKNAKGTLGVNNGALTLNQTGFNIIGAPVTMDATYKSINAKSATFDYHIVAKEFDIAKAYKEIKLFREMASSASKVKGVVGLDYQLSGKLNQDMYPVFPSLKGQGVLSLKNVKLLGFKMMNSVSKATKRDSLSNPNLSEVDIKSSIKNNIITIERTKMKIAGFRPRFEGQVSFDGRLNLSGRIGLPPFGIIGIPLSITGTQEKPKVVLKRNKEGKLEETEEENK